MGESFAVVRATLFEEADFCVAGNAGAVVVPLTSDGQLLQAKIPQQVVREAFRWPLDLQFFERDSAGVKCWPQSVVIRVNVGDT